MVPRILVVFAMPSDPATWIELSEDALLVRRCAYWCSLLGAPASENEKYQMVRVSRQNALTATALEELMVQVSREEDIGHGA
jgi:hypothetical protein